MLDEMAMQLNQEKSDHKEALSDLKLQHEKEASVQSFNDPRLSYRGSWNQLKL